MNTAQRNKSRYQRAAIFTVIVASAIGLSACGHLMMMAGGSGARRPAATEFGLGPRPSAHGHYAATLEPSRELRPRQMQTVRILVVDAEGRPVDGAAMTIDGGMPQHGHGLPTRPRMTRNLGGGAYEIEGVRFNMGGWWEFKVVIEAAAGADTITFNLDL